MRAALREALKGYGATSPNPAVGCVIVRDGRILARGWHHRAGEPHAEVEALRALPDLAKARGATLYVTLEPCCTHGRTPPCTEAILAAGIRRVVVGAVDPHPKHAGHGLDVLRAAGVEVIVGVLDKECAHLNRAFFKWITTGLPWVLAKAGLSLDGKITRPQGEGQWLTGVEARRDVHRLRANVDAVLIGAGTLRADNPSLTVRDVPLPQYKAQPWRVIVSRGRSPLPLAAHVFTDTDKDRTLLYTGKPLLEVLRDLGSTRQVTSVLAEGGGELLGSLFEARLVDEVCFYMAPLLCGGSSVAVACTSSGVGGGSVELENVEYKRIGKDFRLKGLVRK
jgi:diaminohydroxyphosphoribosylaminopyrimidine deaminase/5-amino-6-(5-phosphoribosylamino)uracil reductase